MFRIEQRFTAAATLCSDATNENAPEVLQQHQGGKYVSLNNLVALGGHITVTLHRLDYLALRSASKVTSSVSQARESCIFLPHHKS